MERVKVDQNKLEQELDYIKTQQKELEDMLCPLEKSLEQLPSVSLQPHADLERENTLVIHTIFTYFCTQIIIVCNFFSIF